MELLLPESRPVRFRDTIGHKEQNSSAAFKKCFDEFLFFLKEQQASETSLVRIKEVRLSNVRHKFSIHS